ncbi:NlpC/P60 family protein [Spirillospora sp. NPDC052269]
MSIPLKAVTGAVPLTMSLTLALGTGVAEARPVSAANGEATASPEQSAPQRPAPQRPADRPVHERRGSEHPGARPSIPGQSARVLDSAPMAAPDLAPARAEEAAASPAGAGAFSAARTRQVASMGKAAQPEQAAGPELGARAVQAAQSGQSAHGGQAARARQSMRGGQAVGAGEVVRTDQAARAREGAQGVRVAQRQAARGARAVQAGQGQSLHSRLGRAELGARMMAVQRRAALMQRARVARRMEARAARAVDYATRQLGRPYVWGGNGSRGFDCSGLTQQAWRHAGVRIPRIAADQFRRVRPHVSADRLKPGDLVFFHGLGHVGIYAGRGWFIHSPHAGKVVTFQRLRGWYRSQFAGAARPGWTALPPLPATLP